MLDPVPIRTRPDDLFSPDNKKRPDMIAAASEPRIFRQ